MAVPGQPIHQDAADGCTVGHQVGVGEYRTCDANEAVILPWTTSKTAMLNMHADTGPGEGKSCTLRWVSRTIGHNNKRTHQ